MHGYDHKAIEAKWQKRWEESGVYRTNDVVAGKKNLYTLVEFPYPSGNLHIGHWYAFAVPDIYARFKRMQGFNVLFPIGFDSFGLPAENAAIKNKLDPKKWTYSNIEHMTKQMRSMGNSFDWSRKVVTSNPDYYKWTQWQFLQFFKNGLAYRATELANWCPSCHTVLANEQVKDGKCERCGTLVEKREQATWFLKITKYTERLLNDLDALDWPEEIKESQRNWIGKSEGAILPFQLKIKNSKHRTETVEVFTTRPDTLFGATYLVLAPEHALVQELKECIENWDEVLAYIKKAQTTKDIERTAEGREKTGVKLEGVVAINPGTKEEIPVYIADYVLSHYGTGAVMGVPAHDERDYAFAKKFGLKVINVVAPFEPRVLMNNETLPTAKNIKEYEQILAGDVCYTLPGIMRNSSDEFNGESSEMIYDEIVKKVGGRMQATYKLRDWSLSRQRYWGAPIPIVYDPEGKPHAVPDEYLPWTLPEDVDFTPTGKAPLASSKELHERTEKIFGKGWTPEVDTFDTFVDSSWYFLRYTDPKNDKEFAAKEKIKDWMPVTRYSGGAEHTTMHVLYSRFWQKALFDLGLVTDEEPYRVRMNRGQILGPDGKKMSKSKGNVVDPDEHVARVGADTVRLYLAFMGPYNVPGQYPFDLGGVAGMRRFLERILRLQEKISATAKPYTAEHHLTRMLHQTIKKVGEDIEMYKFNTAISQLMILTNTLEKEHSIHHDTYLTLVRMLAPFAPHLAEELWERCNMTFSVHTASWPQYEPSALIEDVVTIAVSINGKTRATISVPSGLGKEEVTKLARAHPHITKRFTCEPLKVIYVPNRILNFIIPAEECCRHTHLAD